MLRRFYNDLAVFVIAVAIAVASTLVLVSVRHADRPESQGERPSGGRSLIVGVEAAHAVATGDLVGWLDGQAEAEWYAGVQAEADRQAAAQAARPSPTRGVAAYDGVGECTGFAIPDYVIQRESGGNPYAENRSSGAWGCGQVMPMHWNGGACSDLDKYSVDDQRECVDRLSSGGTNLRPWSVG